jgi:hypothetical protein
MLPAFSNPRLEREKDLKARREIGFLLEDLEAIARTAATHVQAAAPRHRGPCLCVKCHEAAAGRRNVENLFLTLEKLRDLCEGRVI